jgi:hypothetical protein
MKRITRLAAAICIARTFCLLLLAQDVRAQDVTTVSSCLKRPTLPVTVQVDCSHVADPATKQLCRPFAENQACKVFWAYRNITGIRLEETCSTIKYTVYDKDKFPYHSGEGGVARHCGADYVTDYSVLIKSDIGPYDVHEMLHVYQDELGAIPDAHILFGPSMAEARQEIGDAKGFDVEMSRLKYDMHATETGFEKGTIPAERQCLAAEFYIESSLYLKDPKNVFQFYRKLERSRERDMAARQVRFNRMFDAVSGTARPYLLQHCPRF